MSLDTAREYYEAGRLDEAARCVASHDVTDEALELCHDMMMSSYWESKDIAGAMLFGETALGRCLREADDFGEHDPDRKALLLRRASVFSYNLASFCWAGWNEPGIETGMEVDALGRAHAETHLRLVEALNSDDIKRSRAWWLKGAYELTRGQWREARECFARSARLADTAGDPCETALVEGYLALAECLEHPRNMEAASRLAELKSRLSTYEHGSAYVSQLETAGKAFAVHDR